ncbi:hypothetical protein CVT26_000413 [Gymnopilus dilepis]|uniref:KOW domain-containing protein n=1 Tax=Gymnopilus dilepis TaxID=231916 RepID=A0A409Y2H3_9AGAR|nr:hypothetical protein CVT26_000413 [Gymnopilus dilepis]
MGQNPFIDDQAADDDDDGDEILGEGEDDFDENDDILESGAIHSRLSLRMEKDANNIPWDELIERAKTRSRFRKDEIDGEDDNKVLEEGDILWEIGCKVGYEDIAAYKVLQASVQGTILARSVIAHPAYPGRVFVEVNTISEARSVATAIDELNRFMIRLVPFEDMSAILHVKKGPSLRSWAWVRVCDRRKRWAKYRGDVGIVRTRDENDLDSRRFSNRKFIYLVPRLFFPSDTDQTFFPPPQRLATRHTLHQQFGKQFIDFNLDGRIDDPLTLTFQGEDYDAERGLLVVEAENIAVVAEPGLLPTRHELRLIYETVFIPRHVYLETAAALEARSLVIGTRVKVKSGDFKGLVGVVRDRNDDVEDCAVELPSQGLIESIPVRNLRAEFRYGDRLKVINGNHKGMVGWVVDIEPETNNVVVVNAEDTLNKVKKADKFDPNTPATATAVLLPGDVIFHEDDTIPTTLRPQQAIRRTCNLGPRDRNHKYIGKHVTVINKSQWKGYRGIIKNTSPDGLAWVELEATLIAHKRTQIIRLEQLEIRKADQDKIPANLEGDHRSSTPDVVMPDSGMGDQGSRTPLPEPSTEELSPAWDASSMSPRPTSRSQVDPAQDSFPQPPQMSQLSPPENLDLTTSEGQSPANSPPAEASRRPLHWLQDKTLAKSRIQLQRADKDDTILEFLKVDGNLALVREGGKQLQESIYDLVAVRPHKINDCVIVLSGANKGKLFKVKEFRDDGQCVIHQVGKKLLKGETDPLQPIGELARTFLFR